MSKYLVRVSGVGSIDGAGEYDGGNTLAAAKREGREFARRVPRADVGIYTVTRGGRLKWVADVQSHPLGGRPDRDAARRRPANRDVGGWFRRAYTEVKIGIGKGVARSIARRIVKDFDEGEDFDPGEIAKRYRVSREADVAILQILRALEKRARQCPTEKCIDTANSFATARIEEAITRHGKARDPSSRRDKPTSRGTSRSRTLRARPAVIRVERGPGGNAMWHVPALRPELGKDRSSPFLLYWNGPGARLMLGFTPSGRFTNIDHPTADGNYRDYREANRAARAFIEALR